MKNGHFVQVLTKRVIGQKRQFSLFIVGDLDYYPVCGRAERLLVLKMPKLPLNLSAANVNTLDRETARLHIEFI